MKQISIALTPDQLETLILACGIAARNSTKIMSGRCRDVQADLIHVKVVAEYVEADEIATSEVCAKMCAEYGKVVD